MHTQQIIDASSPLRSIALGAILAGIVAGALAVTCAVIGAVGYWLVESGHLTLEELTSPAAIAATLLLASIILAVIVCVAIGHTLVSPLRRMTLAMSHLAQGDFSFRIEKTGSHTIKEIDEFARSFNIAASELAGTEMMRAGFISDFSHEFRTPINSLSGFAQLLQEDDITDDERHEYAGIIVEESQRLAGLSERILLLSKMEAATILPDIEEVDVAEQLRRSVLLLEPKLQEKNVGIDLGLDAACTYGNSDYLSQLWLNLLDNAVKFSPEGGHVNVALYRGRAAEEGHDSSQDSMVVWISDEGCGMDTDTMAHVFDRFYQGDTSHASKGSGLGLALCKRIVELHGGSIDVQSAPGKGSVFEVRLPLGRPEGQL